MQTLPYRSLTEWFDESDVNLVLRPSQPPDLNLTELGESMTRSCEAVLEACGRTTPH